MINLLHLSNFYPVITIRVSKEKESDELLYTVRSLVMVRKWLTSMPRTSRTFFAAKLQHFLSFKYMSSITPRQNKNNKFITSQ